MIIDYIKNSFRYEKINPYFKEAFDYIKQSDLDKIVAGKTVLKENSLIVNCNLSKLKTKDEARLEAHNRYIDIQLPISCEEIFGWKSRNNCKNILVPMDFEKDIEFYDEKPSTYFTIQAGEFAIFFPEDAHAPQIGQGFIKKIIIKILV